MRRREFIATTCLTCLGAGFISTTLSACIPTHYTSGEIEPQGVSVPLTEFQYLKRGKKLFRQFIIVQQTNLSFPIYVYRFSETEYAALWMKCTHQGSELNASGDHIYCTSHGSEFDNYGNVKQGPAEKNLRSFPVSVNGERLLINLS
jgi:Rieske Fe-S protein